MPTIYCYLKYDLQQRIMNVNSNIKFCVYKETKRPTKSSQMQYVENSASDGIRWNFLRKVCAKITIFHTAVGGKWPHKYAGYDVAICFRSATKCN